MGFNSYSSDLMESIDCPAGLDALVQATVGHNDDQPRHRRILHVERQLQMHITAGTEIDCGRESVQRCVEQPGRKPMPPTPSCPHVERQPPAGR
jgi:hypothetical protein